MHSQLNVAETERLRVRWLNTGDSAFILELVNEPSWIQYIGDKGVHTPQDALRLNRCRPAWCFARVPGLMLLSMQTSQRQSVDKPAKRLLLWFDSGIRNVSLALASGSGGNGCRS